MQQWTEKQNQLAGLIRQWEMDALLVAPSQDMEYLTGFQPYYCERFQALVLTADGQSFYICNVLYEDEIREACPGIPVFSWFDGDGYVNTVKQAFLTYGLVSEREDTPCRIGVNGAVRGFNLAELAEHMNVCWKNAFHLVEEMRIRKSPEEIEAMREASRIAEDALLEVSREIIPGMTEGEAAQRLNQEMKRRGGQDPASMVCAGRNSAFPHYFRTDGVIREGENLLIDYGCSYKGMRTDITRTFFIGEPDARFLEIYDLVKQANEAGEKASRNGAWIPDIDRAARDVIEKAGYGKYFSTRLGHGIGLAGHEGPYIAGNNRRRLETGMAFTIEPGIYLPGEFGVRIEDCLVILPDGQTEVIQKFTKELISLR